MCCCVIGLRREGRRCAPLPLPGTGDRSPARRGAGGERGAPLYTPCNPRTPRSAGLREESCLPCLPRPPRVARGGGANLPGPEGRAMFAPAPALRPPCGRPGSPARPRRAALSPAQGASLADGQAAVGRHCGGGGGGGGIITASCYYSLLLAYVRVKNCFINFIHQHTCKHEFSHCIFCRYADICMNSWISQCR